MTDLSDITFRGVASPPRWPSRQSLVRAIEKATPWSTDQAVVYNSRADEGNIRNTLPTSSYTAIGFRKYGKAIALALQNKPWEASIAEALGYRFFGYQLEFFWHHQFRILFPDHPQPLRMMSWSEMAKTMATAFMLGWRDDGIYQGELTHAVLRRTYQLKSQDQWPRRGDAFMLRLFAAWRGEAGHAWSPFACDEPIYDGILERWNASDPDILEPWLIAACDRHTQEARPGTEKAIYDFSGCPRVPLEILLLFRLRELSGLTNPVLTHPLMEAPFDRLPAMQPPYVPDVLMQGTLKRVREDWPDFDHVLSLDAIRSG